MRKQYRWIVVAATCALMGMNSNGGEVSVTEIDKGGGVVHLRIQNEFFDAEFAPENGAQAISFKTRHSTNEWVFPGYGGLFKENFVGQGFPGELPLAKRTYKLLEKGPEKVVVEFQTTTKDNIVVFRIMTFAGNSPVVRVKLGMLNQSSQSIVRGLWPKWDMYISGIREQNFYYRPDHHGINMSGWDEKKQYMGGEDFIRFPYAGWTAALNKQTGEGVVWLMDYHWLKWLYNCNSAWTIEWFCDYAAVPKTEKWETEYDMILVKGYPDFCHGSSNVIAGMVMEPAKPDASSGELLITHAVGRSMAGDVKKVKLQAKLRGVDTKENYDLPILELGDLVWEPRKATHTLKVNMDQRLVCEVRLTGTGADGKEISEEYAYYWAGIKGEKFDLLAGTTATTYYRKPPKKIKQYAKPKDLAYYRKAEPRLLELSGMFHHIYRIPEAATQAGVHEITASYFNNISFAGSSLSYMPSSFEEMFEYDVVVLNNVDAACLTDFGLEALREFVRAGGNIIVLGGMYAFGCGGYQETALAEMLPVTLGERAFDFKQLNPPGMLKVAKTAKLFDGVKLKTPMYCFWRQEMKVKPDGWVELMAGDNPFLICGRYGKGKVAVISGNVCGESAKGKPAFWESSEWPESMARVFRWFFTD
ncbi:MAG: glutamine amidotransferase [Kiritimatiellae bacterium]|nr:glutamine amidotransferase [Kiritimatiellia bacterium]